MFKLNGVSLLHLPPPPEESEFLFKVRSSKASGERIAVSKEPGARSWDEVLGVENFRKFLPFEQVLQLKISRTKTRGINEEGG